MTVPCEDHDRITLVTMSGEFTADCIDVFKRSVSERLSKSGRDFVIQINDVPFIDSAGLEALLWLQDEAAERLGQIRLVQPGEDVRTIMHLTGLTPQFDIHDEMSHAIKSLH